MVAFQAQFAIRQIKSVWSPGSRLAVPKFCIHPNTPQYACYTNNMTISRLATTLSALALLFDVITAQLPADMPECGVGHLPWWESGSKWTYVCQDEMSSRNRCPASIFERDTGTAMPWFRFHCCDRRVLTGELFCPGNAKYGFLAQNARPHCLVTKYWYTTSLRQRSSTFQRLSATCPFETMARHYAFRAS